MSVAVKICGLMDEAGLNAAIMGGAAYVGFVFCDATKSRRHIDPAFADELLVSSLSEVPKVLPKIVGLFVDPTDEELKATTRQITLDYIQLHGHETPERVKEIRTLTGKKIIKALKIACAKDLDKASAYETCADMLLFDSQTGARPEGAAGEAFDWLLLRKRTFSKPWLLAGGLDLSNLAKAVAASGATIVDVSSGVETDGQKDPDKILAFLTLAREL